jgi:hypothetical protein
MESHLDRGLEPLVWAFNCVTPISIELSMGGAHHKGMKKK